MWEWVADSIPIFLLQELCINTVLLTGRKHSHIWRYLYYFFFWLSSQAHVHFLACTLLPCSLLGFADIHCCLLHCLVLQTFSLAMWGSVQQFFLTAWFLLCRVHLLRHKIDLSFTMSNWRQQTICFQLLVISRLHKNPLLSFWSMFDFIDCH